MAAIRCGIKDGVSRAAFDAPIEDGLQRLVARIVVVEGKVVAKYDRTARLFAEKSHQARQAFNVLAVNLDQDQAIGFFRVDRCVGRFHKRAFSHASRAPQERVVGRQSAGKAVRVVEKDIAHPVHSADQGQVHSGNFGDRDREPGFGVPDEGIRSFKCGFGRGSRCEPFQRFRDARQEGSIILVCRHGKVLGRSLRVASGAAP